MHYLVWLKSEEQCFKLFRFKILFLIFQQTLIKSLWHMDLWEETPGVSHEDRSPLLWRGWLTVFLTLPYAFSVVDLERRSDWMRRTGFSSWLGQLKLCNLDKPTSQSLNFTICYPGKMWVPNAWLFCGFMCHFATHISRTTLGPRL